MGAGDQKEHKEVRQEVRGQEGRREGSRFERCIGGRAQD